MLSPVGKAPKLKVTKIKIKRSHTFQHLINFVRSTLEKGQAITKKDSLFLYVNSTFSPNGSERINDLYEGFKSGGVLIVNYALQEAWG